MKEKEERREALKRRLLVVFSWLMVDNQQGVPRGRFVIPRIHPMLAGGAAAVQAIGSRIGELSRVVFIGGGGGGGFWRDAASNGGLTLAFTAFAGLALAAAVFYTSR